MLFNLLPPHYDYDYEDDDDDDGDDGDVFYSDFIVLPCNIHIYSERQKKTNSTLK